AASVSPLLTEIQRREGMGNLEGALQLGQLSASAMERSPEAAKVLQARMDKIRGDVDTINEIKSRIALSKDSRQFGPNNPATPSFDAVVKLMDQAPTAANARAIQKHLENIQKLQISEREGTVTAIDPTSGRANTYRTHQWMNADDWKGDAGKQAMLTIQK